MTKVSSPDITNGKSFGVVTWFCSFAILILLIFFSFYSLHAVPPPKLHVANHFEIFSEARARNFLRSFESLGPKLIGTPTNEIGAPIAILAEIFSLMYTPITVNNQMNNLSFPTGLSVPLKMYAPRIGQSNMTFTSKSPTGCLCPTDVPTSEDIMNRLLRASALCVPEYFFKDFIPQWVQRIRNLLRISPTTGCVTDVEWLRSEIVTRYLESTYNIRFPEISRLTNRVEGEHDEETEIFWNRMMKPVLLSSVSWKFMIHMTASEELGKSCTSEKELSECQLGEASSHIMTIERSLITWDNTIKSSAFLDISWSHMFSGLYMLSIPLGGDLICSYLNMSTVAVRLQPTISLESIIKPVFDVLMQQLNGVKLLLTKNKIFEMDRIKNLQQEAIISYENSLEKIRNQNLTENFLFLPPALALTTHFDTAVSSPGGADAATGVSISLEVLRNIIAEAGLRNEFLKRQLMIVLNGGEENLLSAAHGFITLHPWMSSISDIINLEAAGNAGKETILRVEENDVCQMCLYQSVVSSPNGMSVNKVAFEAGVIPGLTDFELYRDYGLTGGFDLALGSESYYYHSSLDLSKNIPYGTIQHFGDTVLALTRASLNLTTSPKCFQPPCENSLQQKPLNKAKNSFAYFSIWNKKLLLFPTKILLGRNLFVLISIYYWSTFVLGARRHLIDMGWNSNGKFILSCLFLRFSDLMYFMATFVLAAVGNLVIAELLHFSGFRMRWLSQSYLIILLYNSLPYYVLFESVVYSRKKARSANNLLDRWYFSASFSWFIVYALCFVYQSEFILFPLSLLIPTLLGHFAGVLLTHCSMINPNTSCFEAISFLSLPVCLFVGQTIAGVATIQFSAALVDHLGSAFGRLSLPVSGDELFGIFCSQDVFVFSPLFLIIPTIYLSYNENSSINSTSYSLFKLPVKTVRYFLLCFFLPFAFSFVLCHPTFNMKVPQRVDVTHFTSRRYNITGHTVKVESGVAIQGSDWVGLSKTILETAAKTLKPFVENDVKKLQVFDETSFFKDSSNFSSFTSKDNDQTKQYSNQQYVPLKSTPIQSFWRVPQGALHRIFSQQPIYIFPNIKPPLKLQSDTSATKALLNWQIYETFFAEPFEPSLPYSPRHPAMTLQWVVSVPDVSKPLVKRVTLSYSGPSKMVVMLPSNQPIVDWSVTPNLPKPRIECDCYAILFGAGIAHTQGSTFHVDINATNVAGLTVIITGSYLDINTSVLKQLKYLENELQKKGVFVTLTTSVGELGYWDVPLS